MRATANYCILRWSTEKTYMHPRLQCLQTHIQEKVLRLGPRSEACSSLVEVSGMFWQSSLAAMRKAKSATSCNLTTLFSEEIACDWRRKKQYKHCSYLQTFDEF
uniref:Uncharacterized protein n=1 Tax=Schistocephalus solidus TaxID=70667 RepID=A0A0V0JBR5_SCHSO